MNYIRKRELLRKYQANQLSETEYSEFVEYLKDEDKDEWLDKLLTDYWPKIEENQRRNNKNEPLSQRQSSREKWSIAAGMLIIVGFISFLLINQIPVKETMSYQTGYGETLEVNLPDGSLVTLNANSKINWDNHWQEKGERRVELEGEAFFSVQHTEDDQKFYVETRDLLVEVLGTSFNVDSRQESTQVYLEEGKVQLRLDQLKDTIFSMVPGEKITYKSIEQTVEKTLNETMTSSAAWKNGVLNFKAMTFAEVLKKLAEIYGKSFICEDNDLLQKPMYLGVPYANWAAVKQALEVSLSIQFLESEGKYIVKKE